ncbi:MAG: serine/threonine-protein kinase, partial [bacterium]
MRARVIQHYKLTRKLGQGGMAEVYKAVDTDTQQHVALKFLLVPHASDPTARKRFLREAKAGMELDHPRIVKVFAIGESKGQPFIAMEYVSGKTLGEILERGRLNISQILDIGLQVADALIVAHKQGIVHRDINPRNIMICGDEAKVMDFGLAKVVDTTTITKEHTILGTFHYMSPEQAIGDTIDGRSDIFSLGVVLYQM